MRKYWLVAIVFLVALAAFPQLAKAEEVKVGNGDIIASLSGDNVDNIAQISLKQVASHDRTLRLLSGGSLLTLTGFAVSVALTSTEEYREETMAVAILSTAIFGSTGVYKLLIKSESENEYIKINRESNPEIREFMATDSLDYLAGKAQKTRIVNGVTYLGLAAYNMYLHYSLNKQEFGDYQAREALYQAVASFGGAIYNLLIPKYVEKVNQKVQEQKFMQVSEQDTAMPIVVYNF